MSLLSPNLQAFVLIAEYQSVRQAALSLNITQTAVTQRLRSLEERLKTSLFIRSRRGMLLTAEGEVLLRYCYACQELEANTLPQLQQTGTQSQIEIKLCGPTSLMSSRIIPQCLPLLNQFKEVLFHFDIEDIENRHELLREGRCDFAIISPEHVNLEMATKMLQPEQYVLVGTPRWQDRPLTDIIREEAIIDYAPEDQTTFNYLKQVQLFTHGQHRRHFVNRTDSMATLLVHGVGYGLLTKEFSAPYLERGELMILNAEHPYQNTMHLAWYPRPHMPDYLQQLIERIA